MATQKDNQSAGKRLWANYVVRNVVLAVSLLIIIAVVASIALNVFTRHGSGRLVPDFTGSTITEAEQVARDNKLKIEIADSLYMPAYPAGAILDQNPHAGSKVKSGRHIFVTVNTASRKQNKIPYVVGLSLRQAKSILESHGFEIARLDYVADIATNNVLGESFNGREIVEGDNYKVSVGSAVVLRVGRAEGAQPVPVPNVVGLSLAAAKSRLWGEGFNIGRVDRGEGVNLLTIKQARVNRQSVAADATASLGTVIDLMIALSE